MTEDEEMERLAFLREKAIMDENAIKATGERIGEERGKKIGEQIGKEQGKKEKNCRNSKINVKR